MHLASAAGEQANESSQADTVLMPQNALAGLDSVVSNQHDNILMKAVTQIVHIVIPHVRRCCQQQQHITWAAMTAACCSVYDSPAM